MTLVALVAFIIVFITGFLIGIGFVAVFFEVGDKK